MCNLYDIGPARHRRGDEWEEAVAGLLRTLPKPYGIRKTDLAPVVRLGAAAKPEAELMRWGFERNFNPAVNNARSDKLDGPWGPAWREKRRCLVPLSAWYEWHGSALNKQTFAFESPQGAWHWAAGLWEVGMSGPAFSMITRPAEPALAFVHDRMPVLLDPAEARSFLEEDDPREQLADTTVPVEVFRCQNPLLTKKLHRGPERIEMLPGF